MRLRIIHIVAFIFLALLLGSCTEKAVQPAAVKVGEKVLYERVKKITVTSGTLGKSMNLNVYLPKGYDEKQRYPVLYIFHGYTGNEDNWIPNLNMDKKADELIEKGKIEPLIIVCPQVDNSWGINSSKKSRMLGDNPVNALYEGMYEDYICKELVPYIDSNYSTIPSREGRYIGGLSMGGFVALHTAFLHTDMFSRVGGHSPAIYVDEFTNNLDNWLYPSQKLREERDPVYIAQNRDLSKLTIYLDCGDKDSYKFYNGSDKLYKILQQKGVKSEYHYNSGGHDWAYWSANVEKYLLFYAGK